MKYFGGKAKIAKHVARYLRTIRKPNQIYIEPFLGSANVFCLMKNERIGSDNHLDLIMLLRQIQKGLFKYPNSISESEYKRLKYSKNSALRAFAGFGCSFSGKWFGGYARNRTKRDYCTECSIGLKNKAPLLRGATILHRNYVNITFPQENCLVYCDPPYSGTTAIHGKKFNNLQFWQIVEEWCKQHTVIVSEYSAPDNFKCVLEIPIKGSAGNEKGGKLTKIEKLFTIIK